MKITEDMLETMVKKANESGWRMKPANEGEKKALDGALRSYASGVRREDVVAFFDTSLFGSGKAGFLLTAEAVYSDCFSRGGASATRLPLEDIRSVEPAQGGKAEQYGVLLRQRPRPYRSEPLFLHSRGYPYCSMPSTEASFTRVSPSAQE
ncbi:MAG: hypothetical protein LUH41_06520 [Clostridiales bacterium]|nr:hypothetical protein [Clostridiales bacterium]